MVIPSAHASGWVDECALKALSTQRHLKALLELELLHGAIRFLVSAGAKPMLRLNDGSEPKGALGTGALA